MATSEKACTGCLVVKPMTDFPRHRSSKDGRGWRCKECQAEQSRQWRRDNPEKAKRAQDDYRERNPTNHRSSALSRAYGITERQYDALLKSQDERCAICGREQADAVKKFLCVDHVEGTLDIRGLLCSQCNSAIGLLGHNPETLRSAIAYLDRGIVMTGTKIPRGVHRARLENEGAF